MENTNIQPSIINFLNISDFQLKRTEVSIETEIELRKRSNETLSWMQPGLIYPASWQSALSLLDIPDELGLTNFSEIISNARNFIHQYHRSKHASVCVAFSLALWSKFCKTQGYPLPDGIIFSEKGESPFIPKVLQKAQGVLQNSTANVWFIVKADEKEAVEELVKYLYTELNRLGINTKSIYCVDMHSRNNSASPSGKEQEGRVLGGRFKENLRNPSSPVEILEHVLIGAESPFSSGGTFLFTQRFHLNWAELHSKSNTEIESTIGRRQFTDEFVPSFDTNSHARRAHTYDHTGNTIKLLRVGLPFGSRSKADNNSTPLIENVGSSSLKDESGIYFIGMSKSVSRIERILRSQFGNDDTPFAKDRLLSGTIARSDLGGFFYAPSIRELQPKAILDDIEIRSKKEFTDWTRFPGIDWSRFNRHYKKRSSNKWMFYNHQDYLYHIGTSTINANGIPVPPSLRVQYLLERLFSKWDDTWYRSQKPIELEPLKPQLVKFFSDTSRAAEIDALLPNLVNETDINKRAEAIADKIMSEPIAIRAGWANRILCNLAARLNGVGKRGDGGMDTCDIHPLDLLAGSMPAQSLAEGKYFINYVQDNEDEKYKWFSEGLGSNSGVGHVVPGYEKLLEVGISGLHSYINESEDRLKTDDPKKACSARTLSFYEGTRLALKGLAEYLAGLAATVAQKTKELNSTQNIEIKNLNELEKRLRYLACGGTPRTLLEALQLIYSCHTTLHLCGEPVAVGRLDKLLRPFQEKDKLSDNELQEAVDCFWIKLAEKVLLNRIFIDDRQELGNMAMGNRAGAYPKGQSVNQLIQQLTVGGRNHDNTWEYSDITVACLRASSRLPFNAPVLSLRVSKDMPKEWRQKLLLEASYGQLSGGASPILMNDDKIIPLLIRSGDGINPSSANADLWKSKVKDIDAHDYAADGCYEPQFVGANWFHLGGIILLQPLEYALNQGRQIQSAGAVDLFGKNMSFRSPAASDISNYQQLEELFFKHLEWSYAKQMEATLQDFGRLEDIYSSPILNMFINDCLAKGQDLYAGGARYNVFGPCFTSLANTINSLWAIKTMCFDEETSVTTLPELVQALLSNWGESIIDPLVHPTLLEENHPLIADTGKRFKHLRSIALQLPRWGRGNTEIDIFGNKICAAVATMAVNVMTKPRPKLQDLYDKLAIKFGSKQHPFGGFSMQPGVGTFASYVEQGLGCAASADGRLSREPLGTDMSPSPSPLDQPATPQNQQLSDAVKMLENLSANDSFGYTNGAPIDLNVAEGIETDRLVKILDAFVDGAGSNVLTVTVADQETFLKASKSPESYDLLRVRMGGWTEMFVAMHALHQKVHPRRPYSY
jgi:Dyp-type peroxidase family